VNRIKNLKKQKNLNNGSKAIKLEPENFDGREQFTGLVLDCEIILKHLLIKTKA
jgi:hypothetical protein